VARTLESKKDEGRIKKVVMWEAAGTKSAASAGMARRKPSVVDDLILLPWCVSAGLALAAFLFLSAALPRSMAAFPPMIAVFLMLIAGISALRAWKTARMLEQQTGIGSIRELPWKRFEDLLGEAYRRQGYKVEETLGGGADGGVDLVLVRDGAVTLVQRKRWKGKPVSVQTVRELFGVLHDRSAASAKLVATSRFTPEAIAFAKGKPIELVDSDAVLCLLRGVQSSGRIVAPLSSHEPDHLAPACPLCDSEMKIRTAKRGTNAGNRFWGCSKYPPCRGIREI
jgi:restriction system protein